jgi:hypothetical protein
LGKVWDETNEDSFIINGQAKATYYPIESDLSQKLHLLAQKKGVSAQTLLNLWLQEKISQEAA